MKIITQEDFLLLPTGTLFSKYDPTIFHGLSIKGETFTPEASAKIEVWQSTTYPGEYLTEKDFYYSSIVDSLEGRYGDKYGKKLGLMESEDASFPVCLKTTMIADRDRDKSQLYAVWEKEDVESLIEVLQESLSNFT